MKESGRRYPTLFLLLLLCCLLLPSCTLPPESLTITPGTLTVLTRNIPTAYYEGPEGKMGFEYDLARAFADHLGLKLKLKVVDSVTDALKAMENGEADLAAAGLTRTEEREKRFTFGPEYLKVQQLVVGNRNRPYPKKVEELPDYDLVVLKNTSYVEKLRELKLQYPKLHWRETDEYSTDQLLEQVWRGTIPCTVSDSNILAMNRRYFPELMVAFPISEEQSLAWIINGKKKKLKNELSKWLAKFKKTGKFAELRDRYYAYTEIFDYVDIKVFTRRISSRLPAIQAYFQKYGRQYNIPWTLLAAKAYQESHWDPNAVSPTGVKGIMMLTQTTAKALGVTNLLDPEQSIRGGARYFRQLLDRVPKSVPENQRLAFAVAAYNVGMGHIYDARELARKLGKDPDSWKDIKSVLPLLSRKKYYKTLKHGYARGYEPVRYVERIFNYRNILEQKLGLLSIHPG